MAKRFEDLDEIQKAKSLVARYGYTEANIPVNVAQIITDLGIKLYETNLPDEISGALDTREVDFPVILINVDHHENRRRFSMAHELGHFMLHRDFQGIHLDKRIFFRSVLASKGVDVLEKQANRFAAELLMPSDIVREKLSDYEKKFNKEDDELIARLASDFKVSQAAMTNKLKGILKGAS